MDKVPPGLTYDPKKAEFYKQQWIVKPARELRKMEILKQKALTNQDLAGMGTSLGQINKDILKEYEMAWYKAALKKYPEEGDYLVKMLDDLGNPIEIGSVVDYIREIPVIPPPCNSSCFVLQINLDPADLADATGNTDPTFDNAVDFTHINCLGQPFTILNMRASESPVYLPPGACTNTTPSPSAFSYYKNDILTVGVSTATILEYCCEENPFWNAPMRQD